MKLKYNLVSLKEEFNLTIGEIEGFIGQGILIPDGWKDKTDLQKLNIIKNDFESCIWDIIEIERFKNIINLVKEKHLLIYKAIGFQINEIHQSIDQKLDLINSKLNNLRYDFQSLKAHLERKDVLIDSTYFCEITGYEKQTFYNNIQNIDKNLMRLNIPFYKDLFWHKVKGKWQTPLEDFLELRSGFNYDLWLDERKRRGEFQPKIRK